MCEEEPGLGKPRGASFTGREEVGPEEGETKNPDGRSISKGIGGASCRGPPRGQVSQGQTAGRRVRII